MDPISRRTSARHGYRLRKMRGFFPWIQNCYVPTTTLPTRGPRIFAPAPLIDWLDYNGYAVVTKLTREFTDPDREAAGQGQYGYGTCA